MQRTGESYRSDLILNDVSVVQPGLWSSQIRRGWAMIVFGVGFILSPLTWWNDLFVNVPIAWGVASLFGMTLFKPAFLVVYWATNILGLLMMHYSATSVIHKRAEPFTGHSLVQALLFGTMYSLLFWLAMSLGIIKPVDLKVFSH